MQPQPRPADAFQLFQAHFQQILNLAHPLIQLADQIDWPRFDAAFADCYSADLGAPAKATRLMVGLAYLKYAFNESDESVVERWVENPYWQYFCGFTHMQHEAPIDPSSLSRWRKRVGAERLALLLKETVELAVRAQHLPKPDLQQVTVDTTVQEKNITYPTDSKLLYTAIGKLGRAARAYGVTLRQSYLRVGKRAATMAGRYAHAKQFRRMRRELKRLRTWVGRLIRDIRRKVTQVPEDLAETLAKAERIRRQQPSDSHKLYSWHEPEVQCISKGKARQRYEFGQKVALRRPIAAIGSWPPSCWRTIRMTGTHWPRPWRRPSRSPAWRLPTRTWTRATAGTAVAARRRFTSPARLPSTCPAGNAYAGGAAVRSSRRSGTSRAITACAAAS